MAYRSSAAQRLAAPVPLSDVDELDRTARQVRLDHRDGELPVHVLADSRVDPWDGIVYRTVCDKVLTGAEGAILTTREPTCTRCQAGAP